jgi:hypothetical protein
MFEHSNNEQRGKMLMILIPSLTEAAKEALYHAGLVWVFPIRARSRCRTYVRSLYRSRSVDRR